MTIENPVSRSQHPVSGDAIRFEVKTVEKNYESTGVLEGTIVNCSVFSMD